MSDQNKIILLVTPIGSFLTPFLVGAVVIALPSIGKEFGLDAVVISWMPTVYRLASAMFLLPFGRVADIYGRKKVFTYGVLTVTGSALLAGSANSAGILIAALIILGIGASMIFGTGVALLTSVFPIGSRGKVIGINAAAVYAGLSLGPFLGGWLTEQLGWRSIFIGIIPMGLLILGVIVWKVEGEWAEARGEKFDVIGSGIYGVVLVLIMYGVAQLPARVGIWIIGGGIAGLLGFVTWELKVNSPILDINLFRTSRMFTFSSLTAWMTYSATAAVSFLLSLYLQYIQGLSPQEAGMILVVQPAFQASFSPVAGRLSDRIEPQRIVSVGLALMFGGLALFTRLNETTPLEAILVSLIFLGLGFALFTSPNMNAIMSSVDKKMYGVASGTVETMRLLGQMLSMGTATLLVTLYVGRVQITPYYFPPLLTSIHVAFVVFALVCFGGIFISLARGKLR